MEENKTKEWEDLVKKAIECEHYKNEISGVYYDISDTETLWLCNQCHFNLAGELLKQLAITVFAPSIIDK